MKKLLDNLIWRQIGYESKVAISIARTFIDRKYQPYLVVFANNNIKQNAHWGKKEEKLGP